MWCGVARVWDWVWFGLIWFGLVWFGLVRFGYGLWISLVWFGFELGFGLKVWLRAVGCNAKQFLVLYGFVWFGLVWRKVWFGVA